MGSKILIVEDEFLVAMELEEIVSAAGHEVIGIAPDRASVTALAQQRPEIAFVDLNLRDGPTGTQIAQELAHHAKSAIVFVTANPQQIGDPPPGAIGYIQKPYSSDAILAAIEVTRKAEPQRLPRGLYLFNAAA